MDTRILTHGHSLHLTILRLKFNAMQPLNPRDLLIRRSPLEADPELSADSAPPASRPVTLERFQALEQTIRERPLSVEPYLELADYYFARQRWVDARRILEIACQRFPEVEQAQFLLEEAQLARSLQLNDRSEQAHRSEPTTLTLAALEQSQLELNVLRERVSRARLQRHPEQVQLYLPLATALHGLGQTPAAIEALRRAMEEPRLRSAAAYQMGQVLEEAKRIPEALSAYRRAALFRVPSPPRELKFAALTAAADLAQRWRLVDSARRYVELLIEMSPEDAALLERHRELCATPL